MTSKFEVLRPTKNPESYRALSTFMGAVATYHAGVTIDQQTLEQWGDMMALCREVDDHIDEYGASREDVHRRIEEFTSYTNDYKSLAPRPENTLMRERLLDSTDKIIDLGQHIAATRSLGNYIKYRTEEARVTAGLFHDSASDSVRTQDHFTDTFMPFLEHLVIGANLFDSAIDLPEDFKNDRIILPPTLYNRSRLLVGSLHHTAIVLPVLKHEEVRQETKRAAADYLKRRTEKMPSTKVILDNAQ